MGQSARTTKLLLDLSPREQGGTNREKRSHLEATVAILDAARQFYLDFFLARVDKSREMTIHYYLHATQHFHTARHAPAATLAALFAHGTATQLLLAHVLLHQERSHKRGDLLRGKLPRLLG